MTNPWLARSLTSALFLEALLTLPMLSPFLTPPGCRPTLVAVICVLLALAPLLVGLRAAFTLLAGRTFTRALWLMLLVTLGVCGVAQLAAGRLIAERSCVAPLGH